MIFEVTFCFSAIILGLLAVRSWSWRKNLAEIERLDTLSNGPGNNPKPDAVNEINWTQTNNVLKQLGDRLGRAGFLNRRERRQAKTIQQICLCFPAVIVAIILGGQAGPIGGLIGLVIGGYFGFVLFMLFLKFRVSDFKRELMFQLPLVLEAIILVVESGLGILPAIEQVVSVRKEDGDSNPGNKNPVHRLFRIVYELAANGIPFGNALEMVADATDLNVLRHVLIHLDISGTEGGELVPSLRSLSRHAHIEWKLSVETRVRRLENLVVFPVFISVIGLVFITAAVPLVPVLEIQEQIDSGHQALSNLKNLADRAKE